MRKSISKFHYITQDLPGFSHQEQAQMACEAGAEWLQLRVKNKSVTEWYRIANDVRDITRQFKVTLIINDSPVVAKSVEADGVHLGQEDMDWMEARRILGDDFIIGVSAHSMNELLNAVNADIDYFGLGPFRFTATKEKLNDVLGIDGIHQIISSVRSEGVGKPIIAIGGIQLSDLNGLLEGGIFGVAISSAINKAPDPRHAILQFLDHMKALNPKQESFS